MSGRCPARSKATARRWRSSCYDGGMSLHTADFCQPSSGGITVVDTGFVRPRFDAAYLVVEQGRAAIIDTGTNAAVPRLLAAIEAHGLAPADVDWVILTHIHLDHAGGAGLLMRHL